MNVRTASVALAIALTGISVAASDWPGYLGPKRDGTSTETGLLRTWPKDGPKVLWTVPVGAGYGGPAVSGGKVYLLDRDDAVGDKLRVFDLATGKELWSFAYDAPGTIRPPRLANDADRRRATSSTPAAPLATSTPSARRPTSRCGTRTPGRTSAADRCHGGRSHRTRCSTATC